MSTFIQKSCELAAQNPLSFLKDLSSSALTVWQKQTLPHRKTEDWKYTNLRTLESGDYARNAQALDAAAQQKIAAALEDSLKSANLDKELNAQKFVFVNGSFSQTLSTIDAQAIEGLNVTAFSQANDAQKALIQKHVNTVVDTEKHVFSSLNASSLNDGILVHIKKSLEVSKPIHVVHISSAGEQAFSVAQRALIILEENAQATVIEHFVSTSDAQNSFVNSVTELCLEQNAQLHHYRLHEEQEDIIHIGGVFATLGKASLLNSFNLALGSKIKRIDFVVNHAGERAHSELNGVYLPRNKQHVDYHTCTEHAVPNCTSNEVFRGIVGDSSRAVFNGRIHIHRDAQKTLAQLSNKNLLTSNKAEVDTKPELEIYADDVQCAHGATVAQLDTESLHYFKTRGIPEDEAIVMLSFGFINELVNDIKLEAVSNYLRPKLADLFAVRPELTRHIA